MDSKKELFKIHLSEGEKILHEFHFPRRVFIVHYIVAFYLLGFGIEASEAGEADFSVFLTRVFLILALILISYIEIQVRFTYFVITDQKVFTFFKFVIQRYTSSKIYDIQNVYYNQGIINRIFSVGSVSISTAGTNFIEQKIGPIAEFEQCFKTINDLLSATKKRESTRF